jgi:hypothetical protein
MKKNLKYLTLAAMLIISGIIAVSALRNANDYFAFAGGFTDIQTNQQDDNRLDLTYPVYYIPLSASATYTLSGAQITTTINISQPTQINTLIKAAIVSKAVERGYNIKKIIMQTYTISNP